MTTETATPHRSPVTPERESFWHLVHAEWTKFRTVRGRIAEIPLVIAHQRKSGTGREHRIAATAEAGIRLLATGDRARQVAQPEQRVGEPEERLGYLGHLKNSGKCIARAAPVPGRHGLKPSPDPTLDGAWLGARTLARISIVPDRQPGYTCRMPVRRTFHRYTVGQPPGRAQ